MTVEQVIVLLSQRLAYLRLQTPVNEERVDEIQKALEIVREAIP